MVNVEQSIINKYPVYGDYPKLIRNSTTYILKKLFFQNEINNFLEKYNSLEGFDFIEAVLEYFNFTYTLSSFDRKNIPSSGRVVIIANHPLGALDALSLISMVREVRSDIKIVANEMLMQVEQLKNILIPVDNMSSSSTKEQIKAIHKSLEEDKAIIIFPSGEVSRARPTGIKDTHWQKGFLRFAKKSNSPILPVYIEAKNSAMFYMLSTINKKLSTLFLVREMFLQRSKGVDFKVGELIPFKSILRADLSDKVTINLLKKHLYRISKGKKGLFTTQTSVAHPESRQEIKAELKNSKLLGHTSDNKKIYLYEYTKNSTLLKEIGRLREYTFRKVEEGTGAKRDTDKYDKYYKHIVLWDDENLEIVGAYRIGESNYIKEYFENEGFYSNRLFEFGEGFEKYLSNSIELGRSFVQPKYWGSRALDYLWQGIGAYLAYNEHIRYMFGPVSLSNSYPKVAKNFIITFYKLYFGSIEPLVKAKDEFFMSEREKAEVLSEFDGNNYAKDFKYLKKRLSHLDFNVPTLYKQYADLCEDGGIEFVDFNVDRNFADCVDAFIVVDINKIKQKKRDRYIKKF